MDVPRVNAVGVVEGGDFVAGRRSWRLRVIALLVLLVFATTVIVTGTVTLARYCLTTDGGDVRTLEQR